MNAVSKTTNRIATICARQGSKGVPGKNVKLMCGKPLVQHAIEQAQTAQAGGIVDAVAVSTDSLEILDIAAMLNVEYCIRRPDEMATDKASKLPALVHIIEIVEAAIGGKLDAIVDLDPTSPLRNLDDITGALAMFDTYRPGSVLTGSEARKSPYFNLMELQADGTVQLSKPAESGPYRRQDCPPCYDMNAAIYVWDRDQFLADPRVFYNDSRLFVMPESRSHDIDNEMDWAFVEMLMERAMAR
jgi:CMP-N,N'-diacetyllegionaminic acid synthase